MPLASLRFAAPASGMHSGLARGQSPLDPWGLHPSSQCKYIVYPSSQHIVYPSEPHIVYYPSYQYIAYPSQQLIVYPSQQLIIYPSQQLIVYPSQLSLFYPSQPQILLLHSSIYTCMYYPAVLPALINHNPIPTHLKFEPMIHITPSTLIILTVTQHSPKLNIHIYPQPVYFPSTHHYQ